MSSRSTSAPCAATMMVLLSAAVLMSRQQQEQTTDVRTLLILVLSTVYQLCVEDSEQHVEACKATASLEPPSRSGSRDAAINKRSKIMFESERKKRNGR